MSTTQIWRTDSISSSETLKLGRAMGRKLRGGEVIELISDLGGGKTTFVKGLAEGIGSTDHVHSPSFALANEYEGSKLKLFHLDLYRLSVTGVMDNELAEYITEPDSIVVIEWPALAKNMLPANRLSVKIDQTGEKSRVLSFAYQNNLNYLFPINT